MLKLSQIWPVTVPLTLTEYMSTHLIKSLPDADSLLIHFSVAASDTVIDNTVGGQSRHVKTEYSRKL